jgi:hypothetical protein
LRNGGSSPPDDKLLETMALKLPYFVAEPSLPLSLRLAPARRLVLDCWPRISVQAINVAAQYISKSAPE